MSKINMEVFIIGKPVLTWNKTPACTIKVRDKDDNPLHLLCIGGRAFWLSKQKYEYRQKLEITGKWHRKRKNVFALSHIGGEPVQMNHVDYALYTDGACCPSNDGVGGYGAVLVSKNIDTPIISEVWGTIRRTNSIRAEMYAVINGLRALNDGSNAIVYTDLKYIVDVINNNSQVQTNLDLWAYMKATIERKSLTLDFRWVKGHTGDPMNETAHALATRASRMQVDEWFETEHDV